jgi:hypothetical protein
MTKMMMMKGKNDVVNDDGDGDDCAQVMKAWGDPHPVPSSDPVNIGHAFRSMC